MPDVAVSSFVSVHVSVTLTAFYTADLHVLYINFMNYLVDYRFAVLGQDCWYRRTLLTR